MIIEIRGVQFVNKGAELMLHAILQQIALIWPQARIALEPKAKAPYLDRARLGAYQKWTMRKNVLDLNRWSYLLPKRLRSWMMERWGIVTEADIDITLDASGFAYGDQWSSMAIRQLAWELKRAHRFGKKYIFLPQALGPFSRPQDVRALKSALPLATLICAREESSLENVKGLIGARPNLMQFPDFTNLMKGTVPGDYVDGQRKVLIIPNSNMISKRNAHGAWRHSYLRVLTDAVVAIRQQGLIPVLLNHEGREDEELCQAIQQQTGGEIAIINEPDPLKVKGIIGASHAVICSRFHGCVSALSQGVPCIGTSWSHKYERLFEEYGVSAYLLQPNATAADVTELLASLDATRPEILRRGDELKKLAERMWDQVRSLAAQPKPAQPAVQPAYAVTKGS